MLADRGISGIFPNQGTECGEEEEEGGIGYARRR
jgi:hypothetical protein